MNLISTFKKSRLVQLVLLGSACVLLTIIWSISTTSVIPVFFGGILLVLMLNLVTVRMVLLQWKITTMAKSANKRRHSLEVTIANTALDLRRELLVEISSINTSAYVNLRRQGTPIVRPLALMMSDRPATGRMSAAVQEAENRDAILHEMLNQGLTLGGRTKIIGIVSPKLRDMLSINYDVLEISPGIMRQQLHETAARILVIDQHAFRSGPWFGADTASGTSLFVLITDLVNLAKSFDIAIWFISTGEVPNPYTNELRSMCTGSFGVDVQDVDWSEYFPVNFVRQVNDYAISVRKEIDQK